MGRCRQRLSDAVTCELQEPPEAGEWTQPPMEALEEVFVLLTPEFR